MKSSCFFISLFLLLAQAVTAQQKGYYRTPAIYGNTVLFTAEGDLWKYDLQQAVAYRLTAHQGMETRPCVSPDGKQVAFLGQYEGSTEIYLMDINGSVPKRLTYDFDNWDMNISGWTRDGKIVYSTSRHAALPTPQLVKLDPVTLSYETIPLWEAADGCYDETGTLYFTRLPNQGSKTKRYKGGFIEQIWKFDGKAEASNITSDFDGTSRSPMLYKNKLFFVSDRDGTMNIWSMDKDGKGLKQHTFSSGWDLLSPSINGSRIVYQKGADICLYDIETGKEQVLNISLLSDFDQRKPRWVKSPANTISYSDISPNGNYAAIISRGRLFVSPAKSDRWVEVNRRSGIRFKEVHFMNDKNLAVLSDESGEYEVWKMSADGTDAPKQLTRGSKVLITAFAVSPNEKYIACTDKNLVLRIIATDNAEVKMEYTDPDYGVGEMKWSQDSKFLAISRTIENNNLQINIVDAATMKMKPISSSRLDSYSPAWSADSNWLYFLSDRNLQSKITAPWGSRQPEPFYTETTNLYGLPLDTASKFPFLQRDSWMADSVFYPVAKDSTLMATKKKSPKKKVAAAPRLYDWDAISKQLYGVPLKGGNYSSLQAGDGFLYWLDKGLAGNGNGAKLMALKMDDDKKGEPVEVAAGVSSYIISANKKKLLITCGIKEKWTAIADANGQKPDLTKNKMELANWNFVVNPMDDWKEMFSDAWLMMRDYFYDKNMHNVDWVAVKKQYEPLLERVTDRYELDDLIAQMVAELSALHTFVSGGEKRTSPDKIQIAFLGAEFSRHENGMQIKHIYKSDPDYPEVSSPLNKPDFNIKEGDIITAIDNVPLKTVQDISELLANKTGVPVKLSLLNAKQKAYDQVVRPIGAEDDNALRYSEWELSRRAVVDSNSNNEIGYIHLKAMGGSDMDDFVKQFYPVFTRKGLIIDVRHNFGGNIDSWVLEKLMRKAWMYWQGRAGRPQWNMQYAFRGQMVILCDQVTSSDGEAVTEGFRRLGLGKVIGMRSWGGEIWLSQTNRLVDNGIASAGENGVYGPEGQWLIEGRGVEPDITVDNLPFETFKGKDAQLEYAIEYLKKAIKEKPADVTPAPAYPNKKVDYKKQ